VNDRTDEHRVFLTDPRGAGGGVDWNGRLDVDSRPGLFNRVKGVTMKRIAVVFCAVLGLAVSAGKSQASWGSLSYSGYQPWWNIFAKRYKCLTPEEERLQKFWHDYYDAMKNFYCALDHIDWVAYYKNHGYQINGGAGCYGPGACGRINYAPVFVSPTLQWAVPAGAAGGPPIGPPYAAPGPMGPMVPNGYGFGGPGPMPMYAGGPGPMPMYAAGPQGGYPGTMPAPGGMPGPLPAPGNNIPHTSPLATGTGPTSSN